MAYFHIYVHPALGLEGCWFLVDHLIKAENAGENAQDSENGKGAMTQGAAD